MFTAHFKNDFNALTDQTSGTTKVKNEKVQNETKELNCKQEKDMNTCAKR
jgi:hypothetical protein